MYSLIRPFARGDGHLMPPSEDQALVINCEGHQRTNTSWVIGRILRDFEHDADLRAVQNLRLSGKHDSKRHRSGLMGTLGVLVSNLRSANVEHQLVSGEALRITVFEVDTRKRAGRPTYDWIYYLGIVVILVQIGIAVVPWAVNADYFPFITTVGGTILVLLFGMLPQWGREKYAEYKTGGFTTGITRGNGSRHVMLILGKEHSRNEGLDLEVMAARTAQAVKSPLTQASAVLLAMLSTVLLITVAGMKGNTWCTPNSQYANVPITNSHRSDCHWNPRHGAEFGCGRRKMLC